MTSKHTRVWLVALVGTLLLTTLLAFAAFPGVTVRADTGLNWNGQYWNNTSFSGNPTFTRTDATINFNWGTGSPDASIPADNFAARWTLVQNFAAGAYRFRLGADDGMRFYIDDILILDKLGGFGTGGFGSATQDVNVGAGLHTLRVEYIEVGGQAGALFDWTVLSVSATLPAGTNASGLVTATFAPTTVGGAQKLCEVIVDGANIRPDPSTNNPAIARARARQTFTVTAVSTDFLWVQIDLGRGDGSRGWIFRNLVYLYPGTTDNLPRVDTPAATPGPVQAATGNARTAFILRSYASRNAEKVGAVESGENFDIIAWSKKNRAWVRIRLSNAQEGWAYLPYVRVTSGSLARLPRYD